MPAKKPVPGEGEDCDDGRLAGKADRADDVQVKKLAVPDPEAEGEPEGGHRGEEARLFERRREEHDDVAGQTIERSRDPEGVRDRAGDDRVAIHGRIDAADRWKMEDLFGKEIRGEDDAERRQELYDPEDVSFHRVWTDEKAAYMRR